MQRERREYLIRHLMAENREYAGMKIPADEYSQKRLLRGLMNVRPAGAVDADVLEAQDAYLEEELAMRGAVDYRDVVPLEPGIRLWQGDITRLRCDAIVNAANSGLTGCYQPCHNCIDNCIHTYAGMQLRRECDAIMRKQGYPEPTGSAKITGAYNLPCKYVIHTVGPIVHGRLTEEDERLLESCYRSCLELAAERGLESIAFCCISTGVFGFPQQRAAEIAVETVREFGNRQAWDAEADTAVTDSGDRHGLEVIFNVFKDEDYAIYRNLLGTD